jgi:hypothetical protein
MTATASPAASTHRVVTVDAAPASASDVTEAVVRLVADLQRAAASAPAVDAGVAVTVVALDAGSADDQWGEALAAATTGVVQSLTREFPPAQVRLNVVRARRGQDDDVDEVVRTLTGPDGGFFAGALLDVR